MYQIPKQTIERTAKPPTAPPIIAGRLLGGAGSSFESPDGGVEFVVPVSEASRSLVELLFAFADCSLTVELLLVGPADEFRSSSLDDSSSSSSAIGNAVVLGGGVVEGSSSSSSGSGASVRTGAGGVSVTVTGGGLGAGGGVACTGGGSTLVVVGASSRMSSAGVAPHAM